jgi:hypothetical protein
MDAAAMKRLGSMCVAVVMCGLAGCANGPMPYFMAMSPTIRNQWEADEVYAPTLHRQLAEVKAVEASGSTLSPEQQRHWCDEFKHILAANSNPVLRAACVEALAKFTVPETNEPLKLAIKDGDATVRIAACQAWGKRSGQDAVETLAATLGGDADMDVRLAAARELRRFPERAAYEALGLALEENDPALQYRAIESLKEASGKNYGNNVEAWQKFASGKDPGPEYTPSVADRVRALF